MKITFLYTSLKNTNVQHKTVGAAAGKAQGANEVEADRFR